MSNWRKFEKYILLLAYNPADLLKLSIYLQNLYLINNLVKVVTHGHYMSLYLYQMKTHTAEMILT